MKLRISIAVATVMLWSGTARADTVTCQNAKCILNNTCGCSAPTGGGGVSRCDAGVSNDLLFDIPIAAGAPLQTIDLGVEDQESNGGCTPGYLCTEVGDIANNNIPDYALVYLGADPTSHHWEVQYYDAAGYKNGPEQGLHFQVLCQPGLLNQVVGTYTPPVEVDAAIGTTNCVTLTGDPWAMPSLSGRSGVNEISQDTYWVQWSSSAQAWQVCAEAYSGAQYPAKAWAMAYHLSTDHGPTWGVETQSSTSVVENLNGTTFAPFCSLFVIAGPTAQILYTAGYQQEAVVAPSPFFSDAACASVL